MISDMVKRIPPPGKPGGFLRKRFMTKNLKKFIEAVENDEKLKAKLVALDAAGTRTRPGCR